MNIFDNYATRLESWRRQRVPAREHTLVECYARYISSDHTSVKQGTPVPFHLLDEYLWHLCDTYKA
jgi:hypothetical protein